MKFDGLLLSKKYIPSPKIHTEALSNITFNFLYENSPNDLCHFWNHMSFFTTQPLDSFWAKHYIVTHASIKIHQISHVTFGTKSEFFFKLCITVQCHKTKSSVFFYLNLYMLWTKGTDQSANFQTFYCSYEN